jgi:hypothetical protein
MIASMIARSVLVLALAFVLIAAHALAQDDGTGQPPAPTPGAGASDPQPQHMQIQLPLTKLIANTSRDSTKLYDGVYVPPVTYSFVRRRSRHAS